MRFISSLEWCRYSQGMVQPRQQEPILRYIWTVSLVHIFVLGVSRSRRTCCKSCHNHIVIMKCSCSSWSASMYIAAHAGPVLLKCVNVYSISCRFCAPEVRQCIKHLVQVLCSWSASLYIASRAGFVLLKCVNVYSFSCRFCALDQSEQNVVSSFHISCVILVQSI